MIKLICSICGSNKKVCRIENIPYCGKHYYQMKKYGKILKRTKYDKNEIERNGKYSKLYLYDKNNEVIGYSIIDTEDVEIVSKYKWHLANEYVITLVKDKNKVRTLFLNHLIMNFDKRKNKDLVCDHINRDRKDNRKENLRIVDFQTNGINKGTQSNNTSGTPGISYSKERKKWESYIKIGYKKINLGRYKTKKEAIKARENAEIKYFGLKINRKFDKNTVFKRK